MADVQTIKYFLSDDDREFNSSKRPHKVPLPHGYMTKLDVKAVCGAEHVSRFHQLIGILQCEVELGRIGIQKDVTLLKQYQASLRYFYLEALYLIYHYLSKNPKKILVMDPSVPNFD